MPQHIVVMAGRQSSRRLPLHKAVEGVEQPPGTFLAWPDDHYQGSHMPAMDMP